MLTKRIIPCQDIDRGRDVKGVSFLHLRDAGAPAEMAALYDREGADELVFLDKDGHTIKVNSDEMDAYPSRRETWKFNSEQTTAIGHLAIYKHHFCFRRVPEMA